jgi:hypothetical protein
LRPLFVLLTGLGIRESSGRYCEGRDQSARNTSAKTAEAGLFQTSYNAQDGIPLLQTLFDQYRNNPVSGYLEIFQEGVSPKRGEAENFGNGPGKEFQRLSKECPAFAAEFATVGRKRSHWWPINRKEAEIRPECDHMFKQV